MLPSSCLGCMLVLGCILSCQAAIILDAFSVVPDCPLEAHNHTDTMFIMRDPLGNPEPRTCPPGTYFQQTLCSCVNKPIDKCNLRASPIGPHWYEENIFGDWIERPCAYGSAYNPSTCDCSIFHMP